MTPLQFETANGALWDEFDGLLAKKTENQLNPERFLTLYRATCEHLALAQARGFPAHLIDRLSLLTARGHQVVYRQSDFGLQRIAHVLLTRFPELVRAHWPYVLSAALILMVPALALGVATYTRPELILSLVDSKTASSFAQMYGPAAHAIGRTRDSGDNWQMFGFYIMNNIGIAFQCYVTGVVFGLGSLLFLAYNGVFAGGIAGYITVLGFGGAFYPFVATHSAFELTAIVLSGGAGLRIGRSVLLPGRSSRVASLQRAARETSVIVFGAAVMLVIAAAIEAFWSSAVWVEPAAKYLCAGACWTLVALFFLRRPRAS